MSYVETSHISPEKRRLQEDLLPAFQNLKRSPTKLEIHFLQGHGRIGQGILVSYRKRADLD